MIGPVRVLEAGARAPHRLGDRGDRAILVDHVATELLLHVDQAIRLRLVEAVERDAGHLGDGFGDHFLVDDTARLARVLALAPLALDLFLLLAELERLVAQVRGAFEVLAGDRLLLLLVEAGDLGVHVAQVRRRRHRLDADAGAGLVDHVDRLVGQEAAGDVAGAEVDRRLERGVGVGDPVVGLVLVAQALQDLDRLLRGRRLDVDGLEAALECAVLLDVLAVLVERGGADALHLTARQRRLQHVAGVDRALGATGADQRVQFVDEQHHVLGAAHLGHHRLDALLELAAVLGAGDHHREVEHDQALAAQDLGHGALDDALRQAFDDRGLADAGLAEQHRVVLGPARQDLHDTFDLAVAADHRVQLALAGEVGQVAAERVERGRLALAVALRRAGVAARLAAAAAAAGAALLLAVLALVLVVVLRGAEELEHFLAHFLELDAEVHQHLRGDALVLADQTEQQVLGADVVVAEVARFLERQLEHLLGPRRERQLAHGDHRGAGLDDLLDLVPDLLEIDRHVLQDVGGDAAAFLNQPEQDVLGADVFVVELHRLLAGEAHDLLGAVGEAIEHAG